GPGHAEVFLWGVASDAVRGVGRAVQSWAELVREGKLAQWRTAEAQATFRRALTRDAIQGGFRIGSSYLEAVSARTIATVQEDGMLARLVLEHAHELDMLEWRSAQRQEMADEVRRHERKMIDLRSDSRLKTIMQRTVWERELRNAPFELTPLQVRDRVMDAGGGGRRPGLIPVPLRVVGSGTSDLPDLRELIRRAWYRQPWQEDMVVLDGLVTRPLERTDTDVQTIHRALYGLPVVMIYGQFNRYSELELEVATWGLAEGLDTSVLQLRLPPAVLPSGGASTKSD